MSTHQIPGYFILEWPQWFRDIYDQFTPLFPGVLPNHEEDILVCHCRAYWPCHAG